MESDVLGAQSGAGGGALPLLTLLVSRLEELLGTNSMDVLVGPEAVSSGENVTGCDETATTVRGHAAPIILTTRYFKYLPEAAVCTLCSAV